VTILALGGLLFPALVADGYRERFSIGLLTASGSLGLLLPPALPLILYGIVAQLPIEDLFIAGLLPGVLLTSLAAAWGVREGLVTGAGRVSFRMGEALAALRAAAWELALPLIVLAALFSGLATTVEAAALAALYALVVQSLVHADVSIRRDLLRVLAECIAVVGGVLLILGVAVGLTNYLVSVQVPMRLLEWTRGHIDSPFTFLLGLNLFLLVVGCLERFRFSCSNAVAAMPDVVRALVGHEEREGCGHHLAHVIERARTRSATECLEFGEGQFDRVEVGTVGREKAQERPGVLNR
jgi:C4-dicarboxylate transporter DctM subunit